MSRVKKACVSSSAIPSRWSTQPSRVTLMLKVKSPMTTSLLRRGRTGGRPHFDDYLVAATAEAQLYNAVDLRVAGSTMSRVTDFIVQLRVRRHFAIPVFASPRLRRRRRKEWSAHAA